MASYRDAFPSKYLKAETLGSKRPVVKIDNVDFEDVGTGADKTRKLVVYFAEDTLKPLVLNRINAETIAEIAGTDDFEEWVGHAIELYSTKTEFQGKRVPCIRICLPQAKPGRSRQSKPSAEGSAEDDTVGF